MLLLASALLGVLPGCKTLFSMCPTCTLDPCCGGKQQKNPDPGSTGKLPKGRDNGNPKSLDSVYPQMPKNPHDPAGNEVGFSSGSYSRQFRRGTIPNPYANPLEPSAIVNAATHGRRSDYVPPIPQVGKLKNSAARLDMSKRKVDQTPQPAVIKSKVGPALPPATKGEPVVLALESFMSGRPHDAMQYLKKYDPDREEFFMRLLPLIALRHQKSLDQLNQQETAMIYNQLDGLLLALRSRSELVIDRICFCEYIEGFGNYKPLPENYIFRAPSKKHFGERVQLYVQLRNLCSLERKGAYLTRLSGSVAIRDARNKICDYRDFKDDSNPIVSQTPRRDFFRNYTFHVPSLPPGSYTLTVTVRDLTKRGEVRTASKSLPFRVGR